MFDYFDLQINENQANNFPLAIAYSHSFYPIEYLIGASVLFANIIRRISIYGGPC